LRTSPVMLISNKISCRIPDDHMAAY
jgi:hypothetical protein